MLSFTNVEFFLCNYLLTDLQSTHSKNLVYDTLQRHTDITELSVPARLALVVQVHEEKVTHVRPLTSVDSFCRKHTVISGIEGNTLGCVNTHTQAIPLLLNQLI